MVEIGGRLYMTPEQAALVLGVTAAHVRYLLRAGRIDGWMERRRRWALESSVRSYAALAYGLAGDGRRRRRKDRSS